MSGLETAALVSLGSTIAGAALSAAQANQAAGAQITANNQRSAMQAEQTRLVHEIEERRRREALKHRQAARRARFGAAGTGSAGGSAAALIAGLQRRSAQTGKEEAGIKTLGLQANLLDIQNSNRAALRRAAAARQKALFGIGTGVGRTIAPVAVGKYPFAAKSGGTGGGVSGSGIL